MEMILREELAYSEPQNVNYIVCLKSMRNVEHFKRCKQPLATT